MRKLKQGDYVLATKYHDGDPRDHFAVGFFDGMLMTTSGNITDRYMVKGGEGVYRANGFRRCERISQEIGDVAGASLWFWRYHPALLKRLIDIKPTNKMLACHSSPLRKIPFKQIFCDEIDVGNNATKNINHEKAT